MKTKILILVLFACAAIAQIPREALQPVYRTNDCTDELKREDPLTVIWWNDDTPSETEARERAKQRADKNALWYEFQTRPRLRLDRDGKQYELGMRSDGVVVWRQSK